MRNARAGRAEPCCCSWSPLFRCVLLAVIVVLAQAPYLRSTTPSSTRTHANRRTNVNFYSTTARTDLFSFRILRPHCTRRERDEEPRKPHDISKLYFEVPFRRSRRRRSQSSFSLPLTYEIHLAFWPLTKISLPLNRLHCASRKLGLPAGQAWSTSIPYQQTALKTTFTTSTSNFERFVTCVLHVWYFLGCLTHKTLFSLTGKGRNKLEKLFNHNEFTEPTPDTKQNQKRGRGRVGWVGKGKGGKGEPELWTQAPALGEGINLFIKYKQQW